MKAKVTRETARQAEVRCERDSLEHPHGRIARIDAKGIWYWCKKCSEERLMPWETVLAEAERWQNQATRRTSEA